MRGSDRPVSGGGHELGGPETLHGALQLPCSTSSDASRGGMGPRTGRLHSAYCRNTSRNKGWLRICFRCHLGVRDGFCSRAWCIWVGGGRALASHAWLRQQARLPQEGALRLQGEGFPGCRAGSASHCASRGSLTCAGWQSPAGAGATHKSAQCRKTRRIQHRCRLQGAAGREPPLGRVPGGALHLALQLRRSAPGPP